MEELFKNLHESQINVQINIFFDSILTFKLGDETNGLKYEFQTDSFEEGLNWLENQARIVYLYSNFAKENCEDNWVREDDSTFDNNTHKELLEIFKKEKGL